MSEKKAIAILKAARFKPSEPFHAKMTPWLMECLVCHNKFKRRLRDVIDGFNCKYCSGRRLTPETAKKIMIKAGLNPITPFKSASTKWEVKCLKCSKMSKVALRHIHSGSIKGCKFCALDDKQDFDVKQKVIFPKIESLDYTILEGERYQGNKKAIKVLCNICGNKSSFLPQYLGHKSIKRGCKTCANNSLTMSLAQLERRFILANIKPLEPLISANRKVPYICLECGFKGKCSGNSIRKGMGCFRCGKARGGLKQRMPLSKVTAEFAKYDLKIIGEYRSSASPIKCICLNCKRQVSKSYGALIRNKNGCTYCSEDRVDPLEAIESIRRRGFEPLVPFPGGAKRWLCICTICKRRSTPTHVGKSQIGSRCAYCSKNRVDPDEAMLFMRSELIEPLEPYSGSNTKWRSKCMKCSREIYPRYISVKNGTGCKFCAIQGMDFNSPAFIYLIIHSEFDALKIGIGSQELRIRQHTSLGWKLVKRWNYKTGHKASEIEERVLDYLRSDLQLNHYLTKEMMPQKGHTETFGLDDISILEVQSLINKFSKEQIKPILH